MKKDNRQIYLDTWREYLKGKNNIDPKALAEYIKDKLQHDFSETTLKRYMATIIANLYENGFLAGKRGKTFTGEPLELVREITPYVLDQALTHNYKKVKFGDLEKPGEMVKPLPKTPKANRSGKAAGKRKVSEKVNVVAETAPKKPAKPGPNKAVTAKAEKSARRKPGPQKKIAGKPTKAVNAKIGKKPGRKPGKKVAALVPVPRGRKRTARRTDVIKKGQQALEFFLDQQREIDEMAQVIANYERVFTAIRGLFSREMEEIEELVAGLLA